MKTHPCYSCGSMTDETLCYQCGARQADPDLERLLLEEEQILQRQWEEREAIKAFDERTASLQEFYAARARILEDLGAA